MSSTRITNPSPLPRPRQGLPGSLRGRSPRLPTARLHSPAAPEASPVSGRADAAADEDHYSELLEFKTSSRYSDREKAALGYTDAIVWNADLADDALWDDLHTHLTPAELVELGFFIAFTSGQQRWLKTLDLGHREVLADTDAGLGVGIVPTVDRGR